MIDNTQFNEMMAKKEKEMIREEAYDVYAVESSALVELIWWHTQ
eukprot:CAMPEP_0182438940 /NCGR_PEP_ID=MMETSP1167-20130531/86120_1 /TAXON_ID=2988 /ORGANISM="Mallomonas Sp, Strain CCMP3275" /LENGTH=43 /DNA_ID= /DNA_START= /DNA_END= /DNA_ORIENTATION=